MILSAGPSQGEMVAEQEEGESKPSDSSAMEVELEQQMTEPFAEGSQQDQVS